MNKIKAILLILSVSLLMTACEDQEKNKLDNRIMDYWNYKISNDFKQAYKYLSPGWRENESELSFAQRMASSKVVWLSAKIKDKQCTQENLCKVEVMVTYEYQFKAMSGKKIQVETGVKENWLMKNNVWYNVPIKKKLIK